jgi:hypothetical protein
MKIETVAPVGPTFVLTVTKDELRLIEHALLNTDSDVQSGSTREFEVWDAVVDFMESEKIAAISE